MGGFLASLGSIFLTHIAGLVETTSSIMCGGVTMVPPQMLARSHWGADPALTAKAKKDIDHLNIL